MLLELPSQFIKYSNKKEDVLFSNFTFPNKRVLNFINGDNHLFLSNEKNKIEIKRVINTENKILFNKKIILNEFNYFFGVDNIKIEFDKNKIKNNDFSFKSFINVVAGFHSLVEDIDKNEDVLLLIFLLILTRKNNLKNLMLENGNWYNLLSKIEKKSLFYLKNQKNNGENLILNILKDLKDNKKEKIKLNYLNVLKTDLIKNNLFNRLTVDVDRSFNYNFETPLKSKINFIFDNLKINGWKVFEMILSLDVKNDKLKFVLDNFLIKLDDEKYFNFKIENGVCCRAEVKEVSPKKDNISKNTIINYNYYRNLIKFADNHYPIEIKEIELPVFFKEFGLKNKINFNKEKGPIFDFSMENDFALFFNKNKELSLSNKSVLYSVLKNNIGFNNNLKNKLILFLEKNDVKDIKDINDEIMDFTLMNIKEIEYLLFLYIRSNDYNNELNDFLNQYKNCESSFLLKNIDLFIKDFSWKF